MADTNTVEPKSNSQKLEELLTFNPAKPPKVTEKVLTDALKEIKEEQEKVAKQNAKDLLGQAMELAKKRETARKAFMEQDRKFEKELGKFMNRLSAYVNGTEPPAEQEEKSVAEQG